MCRERDRVAGQEMAAGKRAVAGEQQLYRHIIAVSNRKLCERPFEEQVRRVCCHGPQAFVLREKDLDEPAYERLVLEILPICREYQVPLFLHGHWKLAKKWDWPDLHLPLTALRELRAEHAETGWTKQPTEPGRMPGRSFAQNLSVSVHSAAEAAEAERLGATRLIAGHIYETDCKKGLAPRGVGFLREICRTVSIPVYGIGGIRPDPDQMKELLEAGAAGGCVMSGMMRL